MGLGPVARVVLPATALLYTNVSPLDLGQSSVLGQVSRMLLGEDYVPVLELAVLVLLGVVDLIKDKHGINCG
jgi:hypothetical protein